MIRAVIALFLEIVKLQPLRNTVSFDVGTSFEWQILILSEIVTMNLLFRTLSWVLVTKNLIIFSFLVRTILPSTGTKKQQKWELPWPWTVTVMIPQVSITHR